VFIISFAIISSSELCQEAGEKAGTNLKNEADIYRHGAPPFDHINKNPFIHSGTKGAFDKLRPGSPRYHPDCL
jgi:hypothetical protein